MIRSTEPICNFNWKINELDNLMDWKPEDPFDTGRLKRPARLWAISTPLPPSILLEIPTRWRPDSKKVSS